MGSHKPIGLYSLLWGWCYFLTTLNLAMCWVRHKEATEAKGCDDEAACQDVLHSSTVAIHEVSPQ
jgi:hypothetical protein